MCGALTIAAGQAQRELLLAALPPHGEALALDLSAIDAFDSAGVQLLLAVRKTLVANGGRLELPAVSEVVEAVLASYGLLGMKPGPATH
jgi:anti-anti-sigma factor